VVVVDVVVVVVLVVDGTVVVVLVVGGAVVVVVGGSEVVVVIVVVVVVDVVLVVVVDDVVVVVLLVEVVGVAEISQLVPENPDGQTQVYPLSSVARQVPPFRHGFGLQGLGTVVVVVVVPGVHIDEPGGAEVPTGHGVHDAPAPAENVFAGHRAQDDEPVNGAYVPGGHGSHAIAPLSSENVPGEHGVHDVAPTVSENVPGKHIKHGSMPVPLEVPGWQGCARADELTSTMAQSARKIGFIRVPEGRGLRCRLPARQPKIVLPGPSRVLGAEAMRPG
jgi:hypothetical protein